jgi:hypothetical protein
MGDAPKRVKLLAGEEVIRKSTGLGFSAVLYFDEGGKALTNKLCIGQSIFNQPKINPRNAQEPKCLAKCS